MRRRDPLSALNVAASYTGQAPVVASLLAIIPVVNSLYCYYFTDLYI